jgi:putative acetyltransferase
MVEIIIAKTTMEYEAASILFQEYAKWLDIDLSFQHFEEELLHLKEMYGYPNGAILLSRKENIYTGCIAIRKKTGGVAELKRMYIKPNYRNAGIGFSLLEKALAIAKELEYKKIRLDTLDTMHAAIHIYKNLGFREIEPYYFNPEKNAIFFEKIV